MKLIPADTEGKVLLTNSVPQYLDKEITLYYYVGMYICIYLLSSA